MATESFYTDIHSRTTSVQNSVESIRLESGAIVFLGSSTGDNLYSRWYNIDGTYVENSQTDTYIPDASFMYRDIDLDAMATGGVLGTFISSEGVRFQLLNNSGQPIGGVARIQKIQDSEVLDANSAGLSFGGWVSTIVMKEVSNRQEASFQLFDSFGRQIDDRVSIGERGKMVTEAEVVAAEEGTFNVFYVQVAGSRTQLYMEKYTETGEEIGDGVRIDIGKSNHQDLKVTTLADGTFCVSWKNGDSTRLNAMIVDETGAQVIGPTRIGTASDYGLGNDYAITQLTGGALVVSWGVATQPNGAGDIQYVDGYYKIFAPDLSALTGAIPIQSTIVTSSYSMNHDVQAMEGGGFVIFSYQSNGGLLTQYVGQGTGFDDALRLASEGALYGYGGNDLLIGSLDDDFIDAGTGADVVRGRAGNDIIFLGDNGNDFAIFEFARGGAGNDRITDGAGASRLYGDRGDDFVDGGAGRDNIYGGAGRDVLRGGTEDDQVYGDGGDDVVRGDAGNDIVRGGRGNDQVMGDAGNDQLFGDDGNDTLEGGAGNDRLIGGDDVDRLISTSGADTLAGGLGADTFVLRGTGPGSAVQITDYGLGGDVIEIDIAGINGRADLTFTQIGATVLISGGGLDLTLLNYNGAVADIDITF